MINQDHSLDYYVYFSIPSGFGGGVVVLIFSIPVIPLIHIPDDICYQQDIHVFEINGHIGSFQ